jgi:hypothetical protein
MWLTKAAEGGRKNKVPAPTLKGLWETIVAEGWKYRHGTGRATGPWRRPMAVVMGEKDVYLRGEEVRESERTTFGE